MAPIERATSWVLDRTRHSAWARHPHAALRRADERDREHARSNRGHAGYPDLNCGGELQLRSAHGTSYVYRERITSGRNNCSDGGTIFAKVSGSSMSWRWVVTGITVVAVLGHPGVTGRARPDVDLSSRNQLRDDHRYVDATLTARPQECSTSGNVHTIQISGSDSGGADVTLTVTDQKNYAADSQRKEAVLLQEGQTDSHGRQCPIVRRRHAGRRRLWPRHGNRQRNDRVLIIGRAPSGRRV